MLQIALAFEIALAVRDPTRRLGAGEDHGLRKRQNQIDYHHRIFEWFDHYLTGAEPPRWVTHGERYLERERDLQQRKLPAKPVTTTSPQ